MPYLTRLHTSLEAGAVPVPFPRCLTSLTLDLSRLGFPTQQRVIDTIARLEQLQFLDLSDLPVTLSLTPLARVCSLSQVQWASTLRVNKGEELSIRTVADLTGCKRNFVDAW